MSDLNIVRQLVLKYGWNATAYQIVNPGIDHWFTSKNDAVIGYVRTPGVFVVAGAPVCAEERLNEVVAEWEDWAARQSMGICYFGAAGRLHDLLSKKRGYSTVVLGAQPVWKPADWNDSVAQNRSLRAQLNRTRNKGTTVCEWTAAEATDHSELSLCLRQWLQTRGLPPLHFLVEPNTLRDLEGRRIFVAQRNSKVVAFVNASPIPMRNGWLTEQFVRGSDAPNGTVELLIDAMIRAIADDGAEYVTMGLVPLTQPPHLFAQINPTWLRWFLRWMRAHGRRFYNFEGLYRFKAKFRPQVWEPIYAISKESAFSPHTLYAIATAFGGESPVSLVARAVLGGAGQEIRWRWDSLMEKVTPLPRV